MPAQGAYAVYYMICTAKGEADGSKDKDSSQEKRILWQIKYKSRFNTILICNEDKSLVDISDTCMSVYRPTAQTKKSQLHTRHTRLKVRYKYYYL